MRARPFLFLLAASCLAVTLALGSGACGKRKPPLPPTPKVMQRAEISGFQRGNRVILSWRMPDRNAPQGDVQHIKRVDVYRLAERTTSPPGLNEEQFAARSVVIASLPVADSDFGGKRMTYTDTLQFAGQASRMRYAVRFVNAFGQKAAFSNFLLIEPEAKVAAAPSGLSGVVSQDVITLSWTRPAANADGTTPVNLDGYNIYRSESRSQPGRLINKSAVAVERFDDTSFEFGKEYFYFVRALSADGERRTESSESEIIDVKPVDTFPPSPPQSLTIAAAPGTISIFFPPNPEADILGYKIFRTEDPSQPKSDWKLLTPTPIDSTTFQDETVESGKSYFYYVLAVDQFKNESQPSGVVTEKVP